MALVIFKLVVWMAKKISKKEKSLRAVIVGFKVVF